MLTLDKYSAIMSTACRIARTIFFSSDLIFFQVSTMCWSPSSYSLMNPHHQLAHNTLGDQLVLSKSCPSLFRYLGQGPNHTSEVHEMSHISFLGGLSLHLNHLILWQLGISFWQFGTLPIPIFLSNLDSRQLVTSPSWSILTCQFLATPGPLE